MNGGHVPAHPSVMRMQAVLWRGKCAGITELGGIGRLTWKEMVALADVLIGMVWTSLALAEQQEVFRRYAAEVQWDLDLEDLLWRQPYVMPERRTPPKLVHKLLFSMPAGTSPERLLAAVRSFAQEQFGFTHRYALALHTDEPHPHVHAVIKAMSEDGVRLNIRKPTLRAWREAFARLLRAQGVAAKATPGGVAQRTRRPKLAGICRPARHYEPSLDFSNSGSAFSRR